MSWTVGQLEGWEIENQQISPKGLNLNICKAQKLIIVTKPEGLELETCNPKPGTP